MATISQEWPWKATINQKWPWKATINQKWPWKVTIYQEWPWMATINRERPWKATAIGSWAWKGVHRERMHKGRIQKETTWQCTCSSTAPYSDCRSSCSSIHCCLNHMGHTGMQTHTESHQQQRPPRPALLPQPLLQAQPVTPPVRTGLGCLAQLPAAHAAVCILLLGALYLVETSRGNKVKTQKPLKTSNEEAVLHTSNLGSACCSA